MRDAKPRQRRRLFCVTIKLEYVILQRSQPAVQEIDALRQALMFFLKL
jgi:hypothetical protein